MVRGGSLVLLDVGEVPVELEETWSWSCARARCEVVREGSLPVVVLLVDVLPDVRCVRDGVRPPPLTDGALLGAPGGAAESERVGRSDRVDSTDRVGSRPGRYRIVARAGGARPARRHRRLGRECR